MNRKILLVEDNDLNQDMLSRFLELFGFQVVVAGDGLQAIEKARAEIPGLILMDMSLPRLDGWEATRRLKAEAATRAIPVVALTAHAMMGDREKALGAGCDEYENKPIDMQRLLGKIEILLSKDGIV